MAVLSELRNWNKQDYANWGKNRLIFTGGRILLGLVLGAAAALGWNIGLLGLVALGCTTLLQSVIIWRDQKQHEERLTQDYRDEIAGKLNLSPAQVKVHDLHTVANGDPEMGLPGNDVLKEDINRSGWHQLMRLGATIASAAVMLTAFLLIPESTMTWITHGYQQVLQTITFGLLGSSEGHIWQPVSAMLFSGIGMSILNNLFDYGFEYVAGMNQRTTAAYIRDIRTDISKGKDISYEQVFSVFVAADKVLANTIKQEFGNAYEQLKPIEQAQALLKYGKHYPIVELTDKLNSRVIEPNELAFAAVGQKSGVANNAAQSYSQSHSVAHHVGPGLLVDIAPETTNIAAQDNALMAPSPPIANDNRHTSFVERIGQQNKGDQSLSHVQRLEQSRQIAQRDIEPKR